MKFCDIFLFFLLLKCKDISTNAKEVTCQEQALNYVQILMGNPGISAPYTSGHVLVFKCTDDNMKMYGQRTIECRSNGEWDNPYPECRGSCREQELNNVQILMGNPGISAPYTSGHVLVFKCTDDNMKMYGQRTIECRSNGSWDNPYPQCGAKAQCSKPTTNVQFVTLSDDKNLFNNFESLTYKCNKPYDKIPGGTLMCKDEKWNGTIDCTSSICPPPLLIEDGDYNTEDKIDEVITKVSYTCQPAFVLDKIKTFYRCRDGMWDTPPKCLKPCKLIPEIYMEYNIQPVQDNYVHHSDERLTLDCNPGFNVGGLTRLTYVTVWCSDGVLRIEQKCIACKAPNIPNAQPVNPERTHYDVSSRIEYKCLPGFEPQQPIQITCNSKGEWINIRDCVEKEGFCTTPILENGYIDRDPPTEDSIYYSCNTGYKTLSGNWWGAATCNNGRWSNEPRCIQEEECGVLPSVQHGQLKETNAGQTAEIVCDPGFKPSQKSIRCDNGTWETPTCKLDEEGCVSPTKVENAVIISKPQVRYSSESHVTYKCHRHFTMNGNSKVSCHNTTWDKAPTCEAFCSKPLLTVNNAKLTDETQDGRKYSNGDTLRYECDDGYESMGETIAKCDIHTWIYPECIKKSHCTKLTKNLQFVTLLDEKSLYNNFDILKYKCNKPYDKTSGGTLMCKDEKWIGTIDCTSSICPPPPLIEDGDYNIVDKIDEVITNVSYSCQNYFVLNKQKRFYSCQDARWETPPTCLKPCELTPQMYEEYNIYPLPGKYVRHSDRSFTIRCEPGWMVGGWSGIYQVTVSCSDGKITIDKKCDTEY